MSDTSTKTDELFLFMHIPKTAGTSLRHTFEEHMTLNKDFIHLGNAGYRQDRSNGLRHFSRRGLKERMQARVILGHDVDIRTQMLVPGKTAKYIVFLRNPASRIVSLYNYDMQTRRRMEKPTLDFDQWYLHLEHNNMTKLLAKRLIPGYAARTLFQTERLFDRVLKTGPRTSLINTVNDALEKFWFVGFVEHCDHDIPLIMKKIGVSPTIKHSNVSGKDFQKLLQLDATLEERINKDNYIDVQLYQYWHEKRAEHIEEKLGEVAH